MSNDLEKRTTIHEETTKNHSAAGAETRVRVRSSLRARISRRRGRATRFGRVLGTSSLVVTRAWDTAIAPAWASSEQAYYGERPEPSPWQRPGRGGSPPPFQPLDDVAMYPQGVSCLPGANERLEKIVTDRKSFADGVRDHATADDSPHAHQAPERRSWADVLEHLWPTLGERA